MKIKDIMTSRPETIQSRDSAQKAAERMKSLDVGAIPVMEGNSIAGIITDRDIVIRCIAENLNPSGISVGEIMSRNPSFIREDADVNEAADMMEKKQIRRLLVRNDRDEIVGIVSLGDLASHLSRELVGEVTGRISEPSRPER